jgi:predicted DNA-binding transcriptional regulator AlpA
MHDNLTKAARAAAILPMPARPDDEDLLIIPEVADMARMTVDTFRYVYYQGNGPEGFRLGKRVVFRRGKVRAWIAAREAAGRREPQPTA